MRHVFGYQPFCLPDGTVTGVGANLRTGVTERWLNERDAEPEQFSTFKRLNENLSRNYEDIMAGVKNAVGSFAGLTFGDIGSNAGYFCYRMLQEGCAAATGVDPGDHADAYTVANYALKLDARFVQRQYNMMTHQIEGLDQTFDIVSCITFMCHVSDPTYLTAYLASITRRAMVIYTLVPPSKELFVRYRQAEARYFGGTFPICFDSATEISEPLLKAGLKQLGFDRVEEIPRQDYWALPDPRWRCFVAVRP
jgi:hypothetical protein